MQASCALMAKRASAEIVPIAVRDDAIPQPSAHVF
jgi:hypothetical protein